MWASPRGGYSSLTQISAPISRRGDSVGLGALAELIPDGSRDDAALVVASPLRHELESLVTRCRLREQFFRNRLALRFGLVTVPRFAPCLSVPRVQEKHLPSRGSRLGWAFPFFRVDLSAVTSKYIGETEKNLQSVARPRRAE